MNIEEVKQLIKIAKIVSRKNGDSWLMSNGKEVKVVYSEKEKELKRKMGSLLP